MKSEMENKKLKCPYCGFTQTDSQWQSDANFEYNGKYVGHVSIPGIATSGDHARCPGCSRLVHIDSDLEEVK